VKSLVGDRVWRMGFACWMYDDLRIRGCIFSVLVNVNNDIIINLISIRRN